MEKPTVSLLPPAHLELLYKGGSSTRNSNKFDDFEWFKYSREEDST